VFRIFKEKFQSDSTTTFAILLLCIENIEKEISYHVDLPSILLHCCTSTSSTRKIGSKLKVAITKEIQTHCLTGESVAKIISYDVKIKMRLTKLREKSAKALASTFAKNCTNTISFKVLKMSQQLERLNGFSFFGLIIHTFRLLLSQDHSGLLMLHTRCCIAFL
jgi:hypothetical protein